MIVKHLITSIEKAAPDSGFDGVWAIATKNPDRVGDTIAPAALRANVGKIIPALFGHDHDKIIGSWKISEEKAGRLIAGLKLASTSLAEMIKTLLADGVPISASIGFRGKGAENETGGMHFKELEIYETSLVAVACNAEAIRLKGFAYGFDLKDLFISDEPVQLHSKAQRVALKRAAVALAQVETPMT